MAANADGCNRNPINTGCCSGGSNSGVSAALNFVVFEAGCPSMLQVSGVLYRSGTTNPVWSGRGIWPTIINDALYELKCEAETPGVLKWRFYWSGHTLDGGAQFAEAGAQCTPFSAIFKCRMQTADLPDTCDGSAARNFSVKVYQ